MSLHRPSAVIKILPKIYFGLQIKIILRLRESSPSSTISILVDSLVLNQCFFMSKFFVYAFFSDVLKYLHKPA